MAKRTKPKELEGLQVPRSRWRSAIRRPERQLRHGLDTQASKALRAEMRALINECRALMGKMQ